MGKWRKLGGCCRRFFGLNRKRRAAELVTQLKHLSILSKTYSSTVDTAVDFIKDGIGFVDVNFMASAKKLHTSVIDMKYRGTPDFKEVLNVTRQLDIMTDDAVELARETVDSNDLVEETKRLISLGEGETKVNELCLRRQPVLLSVLKDNLR